MTIWTSIKKNKNKLIFFSVLFFIGIICGIIMFNNQENITKEAIGIELNGFKEIIKDSRQNQILFHLLVVFILFMLNFTIIGYLGNIFYLFYEGCSLGFSLAVFAYKFKIGGIIFSILFHLFTKFIFVLLILYICFVGINIVKKILGSLILKKDELTYVFLKKSFLILGILLSFNLINEIVIHFIANKILSFFLFLL